MSEAQVDINFYNENFVYKNNNPHFSEKPLNHCFE